MVVDVLPWYVEGIAERLVGLRHPRKYVRWWRGHDRRGGEEGTPSSQRLVASYWAADDFLLVIDRGIAPLRRLRRGCAIRPFARVLAVH